MNIGDKVYVRSDAVVGQDNGFSRWQGGLVRFTIDSKVSDINRYRLCADGYGNPGNYGNGAIYVEEEDLMLARQETDSSLANKPGVREAELVAGVRSDDFRSHTCGECAWAVEDYSAKSMGCRYCVGMSIAEHGWWEPVAFEMKPACPAFVRGSFRGHPVGFAGRIEDRKR